MRKKLLLAFLCIATLAKASESALILTMKDGTTHSFLLSSEPKITFSEEKINFDGKEFDTSFSIYDVCEYSFSLTTEISNAESARSYQLINNQLHIKGYTNVPITVFDISGAAIECPINGDNVHRIVSLSSLPKGTYIVKLNNITIKVNTN